MDSVNARAGAGALQAIQERGLHAGAPATYEEVPTVEAIELGGPVQLELESGAVDAQAGDFVVELPHGRIQVLRAEHFTRLYRPLKKPSSKKRSS